MSERKSFDALCQRLRAKWGDRFNPASLEPQFRPYYEMGARVKVRLSYGLEVTGIIDASTGWGAVFLLMRTSRSIGSHWTLGAGDKVVAVKTGRRYRSVEPAGEDHSDPAHDPDHPENVRRRRDPDYVPER